MRPTARVTVFSILMLPAIFAVVGLWSNSACAESQGPESPLFQAVKAANVEAVAQLIKDGADVNAEDRYGAAPLAFAADRGALEMVQLLVEAGAEVNHKDTFYSGTALYWASYHGHSDVITYLIRHDANDVISALQTAAMRGHLEAVQAILESAEISDSSIAVARRFAEQMEHAEVAALLAERESLDKNADADSNNTLQRFAGTYQDPAGMEVKLVVKDGVLGVENGGQVAFLEADGESKFKLGESVSITFEQVADQVTALVLVSGETETRLFRAAEAANEEGPLVAPPVLPAWSPALADRSVSSANWPQFRGTAARGLADGQSPPVRFDVPADENVLWKTPIGGLGHSCPVVWEDKVFLTTAVSSQNDKPLRTGLYGDFDSVEDDAPHRWQVWCLDKQTGQVLWVRTAYEGVPTFKRHLKSTHANPTPVTDGNYVVAWFASEGLYCYTLAGELVWRKDLGPMNSGWFYDEAYQWGFGSSPVIHDGLVYLQCDIQEGSFLAAFDLATGEERWRTPREEIPSWGTPTIHETPTGPMVITAASKFARGYDAKTGEELWRLGGHSEIPVPTPFVAHDLMFITSGYRPIRPIYAVKLDARGDITPETSGDENPAIAWSVDRDGPYMPTPLVYGDHLYVCANNGLLTCYEATTGERVYRERLSQPDAQSFVGSLVAADGKIYVISEEGTVLVFQSGPVFRQLAANPLGEACHATPAISSGLLIVRTTGHVIALGSPRTTASED